MELLVNPYTEAVYPEYGPNMMWNKKHEMHGVRGYGTMRGLGWNTNYQGDYDLKQIERQEAVKIADEYVKEV